MLFTSHCFFLFCFLFLQFLSSASMMTLDMQALCLSFLIDVARSINDLAIYFDDVKKPPYCLLWQIQIFCSLLDLVYHFCVICCNCFWRIITIQWHYYYYALVGLLRYTFLSFPLLIFFLFNADASWSVLILYFLALDGFGIL